MARKKYSCDFETTTDPNDCRVWAYGWMEIGNKKNTRIGNSLDEFMKWVEGVQGDLYFHNLRFDGEFILSWLFEHGFEWSSKPREKTFNTIISKMGQWYMVDICYGFKGKKKLHTRIYDSLKKLPFPVKKIAKDFGLTVLKGDIDYHLPRPIGWEITPEEREYINNDIQIIAEALEVQFNQGLKKMTNGSDSLHDFKAIIGSKTFENMFPVFSDNLDHEFRVAYKGGFTWVNKRFQGKELGAGMVFDVNSLYPAMMYTKPLPYGMPVPFEGEYVYDPDYPLFIQHIVCEFKIKKDKIPCIQIKNNYFFKENEYLENSGGEIVDLYVTNVDLELIKEHYDLYELEYLEGAKFRKHEGLFTNFINKWMYVKTHETGSKKALAKLQLNSLYGKFGSSPDVTGKEPFPRGDGSVGYRKGEEETKDPIYIPLSVFITSWARDYAIRTGQAVYDRIVYMDTDSIHILGDEVPEEIKDLVDPDKLGYWKHEGTFKRAKFLRQKTYVEEYEREDGSIHLDVKCAGMPDRVKEKVTFENFEVGFTSMGKLLPKHVRGGVVLVDTEFSIR